MCHKCGYDFEDQDEVKAVVICRFVSIPSKVVVSLSKPTECLEMVHYNCKNPKGELNGD